MDVLHRRPESERDCQPAGTSRPVVQRLIAAAKEEGIVSINLHHPVANCLDYAQLLQENTA